MNKKPVPGRKTFRLIAAYSRLPREGRTFLDRLVEYLAAIDGERGIAAKLKKCLHWQLSQKPLFWKSLE
jgi:hypothetical protein